MKRVLVPVALAALLFACGQPEQPATDAHKEMEGGTTHTEGDGHDHSAAEGDGHDHAHDTTAGHSHDDGHDHAHDESDGHNH
ncbi:MAG: hypothetical protein JNN32_00945 [Flavobacteriales bacterium]|jgi:hypothetical protein|nr:hypothetical protein [Flavobacteriales bacterium]